MPSFLAHQIIYVTRAFEFLLRTSPKRLVTFFHDLFVVAISMVLAVALRLGWETSLLLAYADAVGIAVLIAAIVFPLFGLNRGIWRYASIPDIFSIVAATTVMMLLFIATSFATGQVSTLPRSVPGIAWFIQIILLSASRFLLRFYRDHRGSRGQLVATPREAFLIYGVNDRAAQFIRAVNRTGSSVRVVGLIDDLPKNRGRVMLGVPILGPLDSLHAIIAALEAAGCRPSKVVLATELETDRISSLVESFAHFHLTVAYAPDPGELVDVTAGSEIALKPIEIEDLLGRKAHSLQTDRIQEMIVGKRVVVLGAGGSIGSELCRQIVRYDPARLVMLDTSEFNLYCIDQDLQALAPGLDRDAVICSVCNREQMHRLMHRERPDLIFHAAALKHVPLVEANACEGVFTNVFGTINAADAAREAGAKAFVLISTDKAIQPTSVMGATKRIAEYYCQGLDLERSATRFMTVRFGNVLGSSGSVVPLFEKQLRTGGPLTVSHPDITRYFMTIPEAAGLVLQASVYGLGQEVSKGRIFVLDMGEPIKIIDLARNMIRLAGLTPDVDVQIEISGLRPGEKLYEELFDAAELPQRTEVDGILYATPRTMDLSILRKLCRDLEESAQAGDVDKLRSQIARIVPAFSGAGRGVNSQPKSAGAV